MLYVVTVLAAMLLDRRTCFHLWWYSCFCMCLRLFVCEAVIEKSVKLVGTLIRRFRVINKTHNKQTPWSESANELYRPSVRRLSKLVSPFADRGCHVVSVTDPYGRIGFLYRSCYFFFQIDPELYSEVELTPFLTHNFSENLIASGIEPDLLDL
jgi:hypothetical protein